MTPIESIFYMIWRGLAIGVLISAPMGPVGILCIQRTLDKGRKAGFYTGIGAALSDLIYCLLTGFGLSFIEDFLSRNQNVIQLVGSVVLIAFSVYLFKKNPSSPLRRPIPQNVSAKKNILGGFLFTFSNPLIIFLIIGLFARFNFTAPEIKGGFYAVGYVFIILGALGWWYGVTHLIAKVRSKFTIRSMKKMNIAIGIVILLFACVGIVTSIQGLVAQDADAKSYAPALRIEGDRNSESFSMHTNPSAVEREIVLFDTEDISKCKEGDGRDFILDFKLANQASHPSKKFSYTDEGGRKRSASNPPWGIVMRDNEGQEMRLDFHTGEYGRDNLSSQTAMFVEVSLPGDFSFSRIMESGVDMAAGLNHFRIAYSPEAEELTLRLGNRTLSKPISLKRDEDAGNSRSFDRLTEVALVLSPGADVRIGRESLRLAATPGSRTAEAGDSEIAYRLRHSVDALEGRWKLLDYSLEAELLKLGGEYEVMIMRSPEGHYEIIYYAGARIGADMWGKGMIKGTMKPAGPAGVYDAEWRDSEGLTLPVAVKAQQESPDILTFHFPGQNSTLRFKRVLSQ